MEYELNEFAENIINTVREPLLVLDKNLKVIKASRSFYNFFRVTPDETIGVLIYELGNAQWNIPKLRELLETILPEKKTFDDYEVEHDFSTIGKRILLLNAQQIEGSLGKEEVILLAIEDITDRRQIDASLKTSEERFRTAAGNLTDVVYEWDIKQKLDWYGDIDSITGYPPGEFPRTIEGWKAVIHPEDKDRIITALENHIKGAAPYKTEYRIKRSDGRWRWWSARGTALRDDQGKTYKMIGSITDITEQKDIQNRIKFKSDLLSHVGQAVIATDLQGKVNYWNNVAEEIYGWSSDEAMGQNIVLTPTEQTKEHANEIIKELSAGKSWSGEFLAKRKDGSIFPAYITDSPIIDSDGKLIGIIGISSDITERKHAEEEIQKGNEQFKMVWNGSIDGMRIMDENGKIILVNEAFCNMVGLTRNQLEGSHFSVLFHKSMNETSDLNEKNPKMEIYKLRFLENKIEPKFERELNLWDGRKVWFEVTNAYMEIAEGKSVLLSIFRDITERKQAESIIQQQNNSLQKLNASKDKFFSIIAHDLKSPLSGLLNMTELMADNTENFSQAEFTENNKLLNESARNLYKLLENLLEWAQIQRGTIEFTPTDFDLSKLVSRSIDTISQQALQKQIEIINEIHNSQKVYADEKMIDTILRNLLSNAVKFTRMDGKVIVKSTRFDDGTIQVSIEDNGVGISEDNVKKLFRIDEKVGSLGTEGEPSTGLGLLLCKEFVEMHGQKIWVDSVKDKGSTFCFTLSEREWI